MEQTNANIKTIFDLMRKGEKLGYELFYEQNFNKMYGVAFSVIKDEEESYDIVQNVMLKLLKLESDKFPTDFELTWMYRVVKNEALTYIRNRKPTTSLEELSNLHIEDKKIQDYVDMDEYYSTIASLNAKQKEVVTLKVIGGYTHKEISKILNKPIGTVQWLYNTSIKKLRAILTAMTSFIVITGSLFITKLVQFIKALPSSNNDVEGEMDAISFDWTMLMLGVVFIITIIVTAILYKKSDKLPTKIIRKNV